jgi:hypothetical protein
MRASVRDQRRREAVEREHTDVVSPAERAKLWQQAVALAKTSSTPRRVKRARALEVYGRLLAGLRAQRMVTRTAVLTPHDTTGLVVPRTTLLITPEEARAIARRFP